MYYGESLDDEKNVKDWGEDIEQFLPANARKFQMLNMIEHNTNLDETDFFTSGGIKTGINKKGTKKLMKILGIVEK